jgi:hypothetical protein
VRTCAVAHSGSCSAEVGRTGSTGDAWLNDSPNSVASTAAGAVYTSSAWVRAPAGRRVKLRIRELSGSSVVRSKTATVTGNGGWRQLAVTSARTSGGTSLSVEVIVSLTTASKADVDDVALTRS